jgi:hypothetical protein
MEQQERFQGEGRQSWPCKPGCSSLLCPSPSLKLLHCTPHTHPLPPTHAQQLSLTGSRLITYTHVFWTWGEEVEEGDWECNSRLGRAGEPQSKKIDWEQQEAVGRPAEIRDKQHLYPNLLSPRPLLALSSSLPVLVFPLSGRSLSLECSYYPQAPP